MEKYHDLQLAIELRKRYMIHRQRFTGKQVDATKAEDLKELRAKCERLTRAIEGLDNVELGDIN